MYHFILKRIFSTILTLWVVSLIIFLLLELSPGSVATKVLGPYSTEEQRHLWLEANGYYDPLIDRYFLWLQNILNGDLGYSTRFQTDVEDILWPHLVNSLYLIGLVLLIVVPVGLIMGAIAGAKEGSLTDKIISFICIITTSIPEYANAFFYTIIFVYSLKWLPGTSSMVEGFNWYEIILPVLVLVTYCLGYLARITRASVSSVMKNPYIRTAYLKGVPMKHIIFKHSLKNALMAPFTAIMLEVNWLLSGIIVIEFFFSYKGFGALLLEASLNQDIYLIEACTLIAVVIAIASQTIADIGYVYFNPKLRKN